MSKILGKIEDLDKGSTLTSENLYPLLEHAYLLISDYFEIDQCHSIVHHLRVQMKELENCRSMPDKNPAGTESVLDHAQKSSANELRIFISHL
ncbi:MAG: hypothetical protein KFF73_01920 [Cyclobacteriaceae bacterium]|nr:hypothetical protein [Cyclobacteriaceae bacterium]